MNDILFIITSFTNEKEWYGNRRGQWNLDSDQYVAYVFENFYIEYDDLDGKGLDKVILVLIKGIDNDNIVSKMLEILDQEINPFILIHPGGGRQITDIEALLKDDANENEWRNFYRDYFNKMIPYSIQDDSEFIINLIESLAEDLKSSNNIDRFKNNVQTMINSIKKLTKENR